MGSMSIYANSGFNGDQVIEEVDTPPNLGGGHMVIRMVGPGGPVDPAKMTPEQKVEFDKARLLANRREYAKLALGLFAASPATYPLEFAYAGEAEAAEGTADVIDVKGAGDFAVRLFIDRQTHLPLMLSWHDKEPLMIQMGGPGSSFSSAGGSVNTRVVQGSGGPMSKDEREKLEQDIEARRKDAEAKRRVVEFRLYYADYQDVGGVKLPHRLQRAIDGKTTEEVVFDEFKVNPKIDARKFQPTSK
jgi:hypothetical protein